MTIYILPTKTRGCAPQSLATDENGGCLRQNPHLPKKHRFRHPDLEVNEVDMLGSAELSLTGKYNSQGINLWITGLTAVSGQFGVEFPNLWPSCTNRRHLGEFILGNRPKTVSGSMVSNTELSDFFRGSLSSGERTQ